MKVNFYKCVRPFFIALSLGSILLVGCHQQKALNQNAGGGVSVGNGMQNPAGTQLVYYSSKNGFGFKYSPNLDLDVLSDAHVRLSNRRIAKSVPGAQEATMDVEGIQSAVQAPSNIPELIQFAQSRPVAAGLQFNALQSLNEGSLGISAAKPGDGPAGAYRLFYILTQAKALVQIDLNAPKNSPHWEEVAQASESFTEDNTAPVVTGFEVTSSNPTAGGLLSLRIHTCDDLSGLIGGKIKTEWEGANDDLPGFDFEKEILEYNAKDKTVTVQAPIPKETLGGNYHLKKMILSDLAGNRRMIELKSSPFDPTNQLGTYTVRESFDSITTKTLPAVQIEVSSFAEVDNHAPEVGNISLKNPEILLAENAQAGTIEVLLDAKDDVSGLVGGELVITWSLTNSPVEQNHGYEVTLASIIAQRHWVGRSLYLVPLAFKALPAGTYVSKSIRVTDKAGNDLHATPAFKMAHTRPVEAALKLTVRANQPVEMETGLPRVDKIELVSNVVRAGHKFSLFIRYFAEGLSMQGGTIEAVFESLPSGSHPPIVTKATVAHQLFEIDAFGLECQTPDSDETIRYRLKTLTLTNRFGFSTQLEALPWDGISVPHAEARIESLVGQSPGPLLPLIEIEAAPPNMP